MRTRLLLPVSVRLRVVQDSALQPREGRQGGRGGSWQVTGEDEEHALLR